LKEAGIDDDQETRPFSTGIDPAAEPEAYADAVRVDALVLELARAIAREIAREDYMASLAEMRDDRNRS
jgi:hypothetical protein